MTTHMTLLRSLCLGQISTNIPDCQRLESPAECIIMTMHATPQRLT